MELQILISSLKKDFSDIDVNTKKYPNLVIINQTPKKLNSERNMKNIGDIKWINIDQKGLSKSRNHALSIADKPLVYLTDDDVVLKEDISETVIRAFQENPEYDVLAFNFEEMDGTVKNNVSEEKDIGYLESMKLSSVQLVFKLDFIKKNNLHFDELFGAGARYSMGEENIFLFDALKKGAKIKYIPKAIIKLKRGESTWFTGFNEKYLFDKGASFYRMFGKLAPLYSLTYCIRKRNLYKDRFGVSTAFKYSLQGMQDYISIKQNEK